MADTKDVNTIALYKTVKDRYGNKHRVYSVKLKDIQTVTEFTEKYDPDYFGMYFLSPVLDDDGEVERNADGNINYENGFVNDLVEIVMLALDGRETKEQVLEWIDLKVGREIVMIFLGLSSFKKKQK